MPYGTTLSLTSGFCRQPSRSVSHKWLEFRCAQNGLGRGATREHIRSDLGPRSNEAQAVFGATLRAAVLFVSRGVPRSLQTADRYARRSRLAGDENPLRRNSSHL